MKPDQVVLIYKKSQISEVAKGPFTRIYYGSETCDFLIPSKSDINALQKIHKKLKIDFTIVTPWMTQHNFYLVERMIRYLSTISPFAEIVVNDWGVINLISERYPKFCMIFGRILNRQRRSNFIADQDVSDVQLVEDLKDLKKDDRKYLKASILQNGYATQLLKSINIKRIGLDNAKQGLLLGTSTDIKIDLYYPYVYLTSSSNCFTRSLAMKPFRFERTDQCNKPCLKTKIRKVKICGEDIYLVGNHQSYFNNKLNPKVLQKIDRLIEVKL
jgi:hypothetical protein